MRRVLIVLQVLLLLWTLVAATRNHRVPQLSGGRRSNVRRRWLGGMKDKESKNKDKDKNNDDNSRE
eukprot:37430-Ditylum_brightwellii.AAC.1